MDEILKMNDTEKLKIADQCMKTIINHLSVKYKMDLTIDHNFRPDLVIRIIDIAVANEIKNTLQDLSLQGK